MKKNICFKIFTIMFLTSLVTIPVNAQTFHELQNSNYNQIKLIEDVVEDEKFIRETNEYMKKSIGEDYKEKLANNYKAVKNAQKMENTFKKNGNGTSIYPQYIGGLYINENDNLVVQVVKKNIPNSKNKEYSNYEKIKQIDNNANIEYVEYSYEELKNIHDIVLNEYFGKVENIRGLYINTSSNRVTIELEKYNEKEIKKIKENVINSEMISFEQAGSFENIANINPGAQFTSSIGKGCSYGYRAKTSTGQVGIVSAGHCFSGTGNTISGVGTVTMHRNNTTLDAAFIATNSGITPTNTLNQNPPFSSYNTISTTVVSKFSGQRIAKLDYVTGYTVGGIISANYSYTDGNGNTYTNLIRANLLVDNGDSGGVVIETTLTFPNTSYATIGIARSKGNGSYSGQALITKASLINSTFGLSRY